MLTGRPALVRRSLSGVSLPRLSLLLVLCALLATASLLPASCALAELASRSSSIVSEEASAVSPLYDMYTASPQRRTLRESPSWCAFPDVDMEDQPPQPEWPDAMQMVLLFDDHIQLANHSTLPGNVTIVNVVQDGRNNYRLDVLQADYSVLQFVIWRVNENMSFSEFPGSHCSPEPYASDENPIPLPDLSGVVFNSTVEVEGVAISLWQGEDARWGEFEFATLLESGFPLGWTFSHEERHTAGVVDVLNYLPGPQDRFMFVPGPTCFLKSPTE